MLHYILQVIFFQLSFLLVYEFLLKKETFFSYNRFYLLITPVLAFFLPLLRIPVLAEAVPQSARIMLPEVWLGAASNQAIHLPAVILETTQPMAVDWITIIYLTGFGITFYLFLRKYISLNRLFRFSSTSETKDFRLIEIPDSRIACTFFNTVFLGEEFSEAEKKTDPVTRARSCKAKTQFRSPVFRVSEDLLLVQSSGISLSVAACHAARVHRRCRGCKDYGKEQLF